MGKHTEADERKLTREEKQRIIEERTGITPYERTKAKVYATGNRWQIENFEAVNGRGW